MAFFDKLYDAKTENGKKRLPIYLLKENGTHSYLVKMDRARIEQEPITIQEPTYKPNKKQQPLIKAVSKQRVPKPVIRSIFKPTSNIDSSSNSLANSIFS